MGAIYFKDEAGGTNAVAAGVGPGATRAAGPGTADAEAEAAGLFAGLDDDCEPAVEGMHLRFMKDIQAGGITVRSGTEAAGATHFETYQRRIQRAQISILVHHRNCHICQVLAVRGQAGAGSFQKKVMGSKYSKVVKLNSSSYNS